MKFTTIINNVLFFVIAEFLIVSFAEWFKLKEEGKRVNKSGASKRERISSNIFFNLRLVKSVNR